MPRYSKRVDKGGRAVVPNAVLEASEYPVLTGRDTTFKSSVPLGIGLRVREADGSTKALPLFFVSEDAAKSRNIQSGWYVEANMDKQFEVVITNVHKKGEMHVFGEKLGEKEVARGDLFVVGVDACLKSYFAPDCGMEAVCKGFTVKKERTSVSTRPFRFASTKVEDDDSLEAKSGLGTIVLRVSRVVQKKKRTLVEKKRKLEDAGAVSEKIAKKDGIGVHVSAGSLEEEPRSRGIRFKCVSKTSVASITLFVREAYWLRLKKIIGDGGNAWKGPVPSSHVIVGDGGASSSSKKRKVKVENGSASKKAKPNDDIVIDLTGEN